jgi:hypothetical protein
VSGFKKQSEGLGRQLSGEQVPGCVRPGLDSQHWKRKRITYPLDMSLGGKNVCLQTCLWETGTHAWGLPQILAGYELDRVDLSDVGPSVPSTGRQWTHVLLSPRLSPPAGSAEPIGSRKFPCSVMSREPRVLEHWQEWDQSLVKQHFVCC